MDEMVKENQKAYHHLMVVCRENGVDLGDALVMLENRMSKTRRKHAKNRRIAMEQLRTAQREEYDYLRNERIKTIIKLVETGELT